MKYPSPKRAGGSRTIRLLLGWLLILGGVLTFPLPIPLGLLMLVGGGTLLAHDNDRIRAWLRRQRGRYPVFSERLRRLEQRLPAWMGRLLRRTDPGRRKRQPIGEQE